MKKKSKFGKINASDLLTGLLYIVVGSLFGGAIDYVTALQNGTEFSWYATILSAATAGLTYLKLALFSNSNGDLYKKE